VEVVYSVEDVSVTVPDGDEVGVPLRLIGVEVLEKLDLVEVVE